MYIIYSQDVTVGNDVMLRRKGMTQFCSKGELKHTQIQIIITGQLTTRITKRAEGIIEDIPNKYGL